MNKMRLSLPFFVKRHSFVNVKVTVKGTSRHKNVLLYRSTTLFPY